MNYVSIKLFEKEERRKKGTEGGKEEGSKAVRKAKRKGEKGNRD